MSETVLKVQTLLGSQTKYIHSTVVIILKAFLYNYYCTVFMAKLGNVFYSKCSVDLGSMCNYFVK